MMDRLPCPACGPAQHLSNVDLSSASGLGLQCCFGCGGILARKNAAELAPGNDASKRIEVPRTRGNRCRTCGAHAKLESMRCSVCMGALHLNCAHCSQAMSMVVVAGIGIDACFMCQVAFFEHSDFARVCDRPAHFALALRSRRTDPAGNAANDVEVGTPTDAVVGGNTAAVVFDLLTGLFAGS